MPHMMNHFPRVILVVAITSLLAALGIALMLLWGPLKPGSLEDLYLESVAVLPEGGDQTLHLRLTGRGFDSNTQVSLSLDHDNRGAVVGFTRTPGHVEQVKVGGDLAYLAGNRHGVLVVDISDPHWPRILGGERNSFKSAWDLALDGDLLFVSDTQQGLVVLDVADPTRPRPIGHYPSSDACFGVALMPGKFVALAQGLKGVLILDISDPENPRKAGRIPSLDFSWNVAVRDRLVFIADGRGGLQIVDIEEPAQPRPLAQIAPEKHVRGIAVQNHHLFLTDSKRGLLVFDVSDPAAPVLLSELPVSGRPRSVQVSDNRVYLSADRSGVIAIDVADPARPQLIGQVLPGFGTRNVDVAGEYLLVASGHNGLQVLAADRIGPRPSLYDLPFGGEVSALAGGAERLHLAVRNEGLKTILSSTRAGDIRSALTGLMIEGRQGVVGDDYLFLASGEFGLQILEINAGVRLHLVGEFPVPSFVHEVALFKEGRTALLAAGVLGVKIIDVTRPHQPRLLGALGDLGNIVALQVWDDRLIALERGGQVHLLDVHQPAQPRLLSTILLPDALKSMTLLDHTLLIGTEKSGLFLLDLDDWDQTPTANRLLPNLRLVDVMTSGSRIYILGLETNNDYSLYIFEKYSGAAPQQWSRTTLGRGKKRFKVQGEVLYLLKGNSLDIWDVSDPQVPQYVQSLPQFGTLSSLIFRGAQGFALSATGTLQYLDFTNPLHPVSLALEMPGLNDVLALEVLGNYLLALDRRAGLRTFAYDAEDVLREVGSLSFPRPLRDWQILGQRAYVLDNEGWLFAVELSNLDRPRKSAQWNLRVPKARNLAVRDNVFVVANRDDGIQVWTLDDETAPRLLDQMQIPWPRGEFARAEDVALVGERILVANGHAGLTLLELKTNGRLRFVETLDLAGYCRKIKVYGGLVLIESHQAGIHLVDISDPRRLVHAGTIQALDSLADFLLEGHQLWMAHSSGVTAIPLPLAGRRIGLQSSERLDAEFSLPSMAGPYTVRVMRGRQSFELPGALFISAGGKSPKFSLADAQK
jgi:hypothetical protein